jgi:glycosyltransferase involved in cell wall biosynthesis
VVEITLAGDIAMSTNARSNGTHGAHASPPVTVAVPSIGRLKYLPALRASLDAQTMGDFEVLVLDNESPPEAQDLFADWARADRRVKVLRACPRIEMFANFNRGYHLGKGKYLVFFHDDDEYSPRFVEQHFELLEREPRVAFSGSNNDFIDETGRITGRRRLITKTEAMAGREFIRFLMSTGRNLTPMQSIAYRRSALAPDGIDEKLSCYYGDFVLLMRMAERCQVGTIADALVRVRRHDEQWSVTDNRTANKSAWTYAEAMSLRARMMRSYLAEYRSRWPNDTSFALELERGFRRSVRKGAIWGWLNAVDDAAAVACLQSLGESWLDHEISVVLKAIGGIGIDAHVRTAYVAPLLRKVGNVVRA